MNNLVYLQRRSVLHVGKGRMKMVIKLTAMILLSFEPEAGGKSDRNLDIADIIHAMLFLPEAVVSQYD